MIIPRFSKMVSTDGNGLPLQGVSTNGQLVFLIKTVAKHIICFEHFLEQILM
jgi:hypothetical protein